MSVITDEHQKGFTSVEIMVMLAIVAYWRRSRPRSMEANTYVSSDESNFLLNRNCISDRSLVILRRYEEINHHPIGHSGAVLVV